MDTYMWTWRGRGRWVKLGDQDRHIYINVCKIASQWEAAVWQREFRLVLCDDLERWDMGGREAEEGRDICILVADSLHSQQKLTQHHKAIILQFLKKIFNQAALYFHSCYSQKKKCSFLFHENKHNLITCQRESYSSLSFSPVKRFLFCHDVQSFVRRD